MPLAGVCCPPPEWAVSYARHKRHTPYSHSRKAATAVAETSALLVTYEQATAIGLARAVGESSLPGRILLVCVRRLDQRGPSRLSLTKLTCSPV